MNEELKLMLLREHNRDKKLTYIAYSLVIAIAAVLIFFLSGFILSFLDAEQLYPKLALGAVLIGYMIYAVTRIIKISKRRQLIDEMIVKIGSGAKAATIVEHKSYKIIIPLGKITYKMCPVSYQKFCLDCNPAFYYDLPVHPAYVPDFKNFLSGVDIDSINEKIADIYSNDSSDEYVDDGIEMKTDEEFRTYLTEELGDSVNEIEDKRAKTNKMMKTGMVVGGVIAVAYVGYMMYNAFVGGGDITNPKIYLPLVVLFGLYYIYMFAFMKPKAAKAMAEGNIPAGVEFDFKNKIMTKVVPFINPNAEYVMHGHVGYGEIMHSGLFTEANYKLSGNDLIIGKYRGVPFQCCNLVMQVEKKVTQENEEPPTAFSGQFFVAKFNKTFQSPVYIFPKKKSMFSSGVSGYFYRSGDKVILEDPEFMDMFDVYGEDQIEARYILSTALMQRIKELAKNKDDKYFISFHNNTITIANDNGENKFAVSTGKSLVKNDYEVLMKFYSELRDQFAMIDDLKLNIKIWK